MALDVDGYAVLQALASAPEAFPDIRTEVPKAARALVVKQLKARTLRVPALRVVREVLGPEAFALIADGMSDAEVKAVVTRLDPHHPTLKEATPGWHRRRLTALAAGEAPVRRGESAPPETPLGAGPAAPAERALSRRPFAAVWDGKDHDAPAETASDRPGSGKSGSDTKKNSDAKKDPDRKKDPERKKDKKKKKG
ncbi:hypothetical protein [Methylobacterium sp. Leaf118]|uniref:hypothetical protein n=1 Tax=Methylobacterium sp. Leaf118 TaxID=2876562 RepID=UPI001E462EA4|nr:hypothetical protein [Methylobacterium sp. Leaf118]